jgi:non-heme chloroperoxidase
MVSMKKLLALVVMLVSLAADAVQPPNSAPNAAGTWQGTVTRGTQSARFVVHITRTSAGGWAANMFLESTNPIPVNSVTVDDSTIDLSGNLGRYFGHLSADGTCIRGLWLQGNPRPLDPPIALELKRATAKTIWSLPPDSSPHTTRYITVDEDANLEVLDWGGAGRPVVLIGGLGGSAHVFDDFAPKLAAHYHVYGITRRGFGASSAPYTGYTADRLGDDVLAVFDALRLDRPILVGLSFGGEELSSVGSRFPQRVAGLVYLEAGYGYAYSQPSRGLQIDAAEIERRMERLQFPDKTANASKEIEDLLKVELPRLTQSLQAKQQQLQSTPADILATIASEAAPPPPQSVVRDVLAGRQRYTSIPVPILAIFAAPHEYLPSTGSDPASRAAADALDEFRTGPIRTANGFEQGLPHAHVVRLPHASHMVFQSNEADVLREMNAFIGGLPR